jgi:dTDP-4-amino-4,6-dideoxygalactose transaminase
MPTHAKTAVAVLGGPPAFREPRYITRALRPDERLFGELVASVFRSRWFTNDGELVRQLEARLAERLGVAFCAALCNGTIALQTALRSLDLTGEVITTPFTFPATVHAIEWIGLTPVFCDVDPETYNLDPACAAELVSDRTSALLPVHVFGNPCDVVAIEELARARDIKVVYDAAHAFGVAHRGRPIGAWGDLSVLSFHATKLFHTGEGGAVMGMNADHRKTVARLRNFGIVGEDDVVGVGLNGKLSEVHAALGLALIGSIDGELHARRRLAERYRERLTGIEGLRFQRRAPETMPNHSYFTVEISPDRFGLSRDELHVALRAENVITRRYFYPLCSDNECYRHLPSAQPDRLPNARQVAASVLCLPIYGGLDLADVDRIADAIIAVRAAAPQVRQALKDRGS